MTKFVSERNLKFLLYEVIGIESLTQYSFFEEHDREIFDMVLQQALKIGRDLLRPHLKEMDQIQPALVNGEVKVHPMVKTYMKESGAGGWISASARSELGGQQLPAVLTSSCHFIFAAANYSASVFPVLSGGAALLISSFGSAELIETYIPNLFAGRWQGTMALTEPQAGSSLADVATRAEPTEDGYYRIRGQKIFISASDHDGVENIIHLMLARIKGAPSGVKGISLFVVPKLRYGDDGKLVRNDVNVAGLYHKLGNRGAPITQLSMGENDDCRGFLVGEPNKGLTYMFQMMNEARIAVGVGAAAIASAAYYTALQYAKERPQGRRLSAKDPTTPPVPIIEHPDVKRMLLFQRAVVEGSLSLLLQCSMYSDLIKVTQGDERERYSLLLEVLTPVAKTFASEMGIIAVSQALQCLGGYGYCDEFPVEQFYRDVRIHPIHEGTTGIQALDLLGRKVLMKNGAAFVAFIGEVKGLIDRARVHSALEPYATSLDRALIKLQDVTKHLVKLAGKGDPEIFLADATLYLELFSTITIASQWLVQGTTALRGLEQNIPDHERDFYQGKIHTMKYFFHYELPKIEGLFNRLMESDGLTVNMTERMFTD